MPFYAVRRGRNPGIFQDWDSCKAQVVKFPKARYKKFNTHKEAEDFLNESDGPSSSGHKPTNQNGFSASYKPIENRLAPSFRPPANIPKHKSLKHQVNHLASMVHQLTEQIQCYEKSHTNEGSKRSYTTQSSNHASGSGSSKQFKQEKHLSDHVSGSGSSKQFKQKNCGCNEPVIVYTDGACFGNGFHGATAGIGVYWGPDHPDNVGERLPGRQTNNRAEIHAAVKAVKQAKTKGVANLTVKTDSQFLINGITKWIHGWKKRGWKLSTGQPVVNRADFEALEAALHGVDVNWVHVKGHSGEHGNEAADKLANQGASQPLV